MSTSPQSTSPLRDRIVDDIIAGALPFGSRVTIDSLAERYGSSHMPVREALRELHGEGLLVMERNRGARIRPVDRDFVDCMFDTRGALEVMLTRRAAIRRSNAACAELASIQEELEQYVHHHDAPRVHDANRRFHNAIYVAAENPDALSVVRRYWVMNAAIWRRYGYAPDRFLGMVQDHRHLLRAIRERDVEAAAVLIAAHVIKAKQNLLTIMARDESSPAGLTLAA
jgi:DNA-binding GntR family transcriptional regulator